MLERYEEYDKNKNYVNEVMEKNNLSYAEAKKWLGIHVPKESYFQHKIMQALSKTYPDAFIRKVSQGPYSTGGIPDIMCIVRGNVYFFEVKRPVFGIVSKLQAKSITLITKAGGVACVISYPEEALNIIASVGRNKDI